jgi:hypothetical protein
MHLHRFAGETEPHGTGKPRIFAEMLHIARAIGDDREEFPLDHLPMTEDTASILPDLTRGHRRPDLILPMRPQGVAEHLMP